MGGILWRNKMTFLIFQVWGTKWTNIKLITWLWTLQQPMKSKITIEFRVLDLPTDWSMVDGFRDFVFWPSTDVPCMVRWSTYGYIPPWFPLRFLRISLSLRLSMRPTYNSWIGQRAVLVDRRRVIELDISTNLWSCQQLTNMWIVIPPKICWMLHLCWHQVLERLNFLSFE